MKKLDTDEVSRMCDMLKALVQAIDTKKEIKKGDRGKWRGKARRLLRKIGESI